MDRDTPPITPSPTPEGQGKFDRAHLQHDAVRGASWTMIHTAVSLPIAFLANLVLARLLGVADYGRLAFLTVLMGVAGGIVEVGMSSALIQYGSRAHAAGRHDEVRKLLSAAQGFRLLVVAPALSLLVILVAHTDTDLVVLAILFGVWMPAFLDGSLIGIVIEGKSATSAKIAMATNLVLQVVVVSVAYSLRTADAVWAARLVVGGLSIAVYLFAVRPGYRRAVLRPTLPRGFPPGFWHFAVPTGIAGLIGTLALSRTEVVFLTWLSTPEAVGLFALAFGLAGHIFAPADALIGPLIPAVSGLHEVDQKALTPAFERVLRASSTIIALACAGALPAFALLVPSFYGEEFADAAPLLLALGVAGALLAAGAPVSAFTLGRRSSRGLLTANVVALVVDVVLAITLIPLIGVWGAVIANVMGALSRLSLLVRGETRALGMSRRGLTRQVAPALLAMPIAVVVWLAGSQVPRAPVVVAALAAFVGIALLVLAMRLTRSGLNEQDKAALSRSLPTRLARISTPFLRVLTRG